MDVSLAPQVNHQYSMEIWPARATQSKYNRGLLTLKMALRNIGGYTQTIIRTRRRSELYNTIETLY